MAFEVRWNRERFAGESSLYAAMGSQLELSTHFSASKSDSDLHRTRTRGLGQCTLDVMSIFEVFLQSVVRFCALTCEFRGGGPPKPGKTSGGEVIGVRAVLSEAVYSRK